MEIAQQEALNGVRMSWNLWPCTKSDMNKIVVPLGCIYSPLKEVEDLTMVAYEPLECSDKNCGGILNPYCFIDFRTKQWTCNFCGTRQMLPPYYAENISENQLPQEKTCTTMEYLLPKSSCEPPVFLFVVDTALNNPEDRSEFEQCKESLQQILHTMPQNSLVGFVTYGTIVNIYELGFEDMPKSYAFQGRREYSSEEIAGKLGIPRTHDPRGMGGKTLASSRFLVAIKDCEFILNQILENLQKDTWQVDMERERVSRCTGSAINIALSLLENAYANNGGRIIVLTSGPCTCGPGQIVSQRKAEPMRSHLDLYKSMDNAKYSKPAVDFYKSMATRCTDIGIAVDVFSNSLDQTGLFEMRCIVEKTGGQMVMSDGYSTHVFKDSFRKLLTTVDKAGFPQMGFNAKINTVCSKEFQVCGALGSLTSRKKPHHSVSATEIGECGTNEWRTGVVDPSLSIAFFFEVTAAGSDQPENRPIAPLSAAYVQFKTLYNHPSGRKRLRVTTVARAFADSTLENIGSGFDQEAAAVLMARFTMFQMESSGSFDTVRRIDRLLVRLISKFASYNRNDPSSFQLAEEFTLFPQFIFYLRRSPFLETFNCSPDETAFYRCCMLRENVLNSLVMIQPALMEYSFDNPDPTPVLLDSKSLTQSVILLLDTYFHVVIWRGEQVQQWYDLKYQDMPAHENFKNLLRKPAEDAKSILQERLPVPKFVQTYANGSQARFVLSRVNPSRTHCTDPSYGGADGHTILTEDVSLKDFMEMLIRYAVEA